MSKCFYIEPTIYPYYVYVCIGSVKEALDYFQKQVEEDPEILDEHITGDYCAYTLRLPNGDICMHILNTDNLVPVIVHESFHVVEFVFNRIDITHTIETSEAFAYYLQYIFTQIYKNAV